MSKEELNIYLCPDCGNEMRTIMNDIIKCVNCGKHGKKEDYYQYSLRGLIERLENKIKDYEYRFGEISEIIKG